MAKLARRKIAAHLAKQLFEGKSPKELAQHAAAYLAENRQTAQAELLIRDVEVLLADNYQAVPVRVVSARSLDNATRQHIIRFVQESESAKSVIIVDEQVDPSLIGGVIVSTPTNIFDSTVRRQLQQLTVATKD